MLDNEKIIGKIIAIEKICHKIKNEDNINEIEEILKLCDGAKLYL